MDLLPLTETCVPKALNVTCHLAESVLLCWLKVVFNFYNLFVNNQCVPQETNLHTSSVLSNKKANSFYIHCKSKSFRREKAI